MTNKNAWMSLLDISKRLKTNYERVRATVSTLANQKQIETRRDPRDRRKLQVRERDLDKIQEALGLGPDDIGQDDIGDTAINPDIDETTGIFDREKVPNNNESQKRQK